MRKVCVITGGGSGIGFAVAKEIVKQGYYVILCGRNKQKLENAVNELKYAQAFQCDVSDRKKCVELAQYAATCGDVMAVLHIAGMSPHMGDPNKIMACNALGTINMNDAFYPVLKEGGCIIDTSSTSAYMTPSFIMPKKTYKLALSNPNQFMKKIMKRVHLFPKKAQAGVAYAISKHFVIWYAKQDAFRYAKKNCRVLSITPGNFDTPLGSMEKEEASTYNKFSAIPRNGKPDEIGPLYAYLSDPRLSYLTGTDILCDGGCIAGGASALKR
jgi:NAD(P)-dependent dehydrogenase (short-subunit alcohol dehydrogenase family)